MARPPARRSPRRAPGAAGRSPRAGSRRSARSPPPPPRRAPPPPRTLRPAPPPAPGRPGDGAKTSFATASWSGWISVLPSKPISRPCTQAARSPSWSWKALKTPSTQTSPSARAASRQSPRLATSGSRSGVCAAPSSLTRSFVPMTNPSSRGCAAATAPAFSIARGVSIIAQMRAALRRAVPLHQRRPRGWRSAGVSTLGRRIASGPAAQARARSASPHSVSSPLTRTRSLRRP